MLINFCPLEIKMHPCSWCYNMNIFRWCVFTCIWFWVICNELYDIWSVGSMFQKGTGFVQTVNPRRPREVHWNSEGGHSQRRKKRKRTWKRRKKRGERKILMNAGSGCLHRTGDFHISRKFAYNLWKIERKRLVLTKKKIQHQLTKITRENSWNLM